MLQFLQYFLVGLVAFEHVYFMILEMFFWDKPKGLAAFGMSLEDARKTKVLAKNQGLYNGFLAAGLIWAILSDSSFVPRSLFFLSCVVIAGVVGAITTKKKMLFFVQSIPAIVGIIVILLNN